MNREKRCLYCYLDMEDEMLDFHPACSRKIFGNQQQPELPYTKQQILELGQKIVRSQIAVTGVQPKISIDIEAVEKSSRKFTIVGLWGGYILKPPSDHYVNLPEVEDLTMHLAGLAKINTVPHSLIRLKDDSLAYITKRIDRRNESKIHMEDMCQITERLTENKYDGSYEQIAKAILKFSSNPVLDAINFYEQVLFSFITGNADMHLKNFSLINEPGLGYVLAPAYDMVATALVNKADKEETALTLNAKKRKIKQDDFLQAFKRINLDTKIIDTMFKKFANALPAWAQFIEISFLPEAMKKEYKELIAAKAKQIRLA
jgi:serine/threonine-protein kinase HipA